MAREPFIPCSRLHEGQHAGFGANTVAVTAIHRWPLGATPNPVYARHAPWLSGQNATGCRCIAERCRALRRLGDFDRPGDRSAVFRTINRPFSLLHPAKSSARERSGFDGGDDQEEMQISYLSFGGALTLAGSPNARPRAPNAILPRQRRRSLRDLCYQCSVCWDSGVDARQSALTP